MRKTILAFLIALSLMCFISCSSEDVLAPFSDRFDSITENTSKQDVIETLGDNYEVWAEITLNSDLTIEGKDGDGLYIWAYTDDIKYIIIFVDDLYHAKQSFSDDSWKETKANFKALEDIYGKP